MQRGPVVIDEGSGTFYLIMRNECDMSVDLLSSAGGPDSRGGEEGWCRRTRVRYHK